MCYTQWSSLKLLTKATLDVKWKMQYEYDMKQHYSKITNEYFIFYASLTISIGYVRL